MEPEASRVERRRGRRALIASRRFIPSKFYPADFNPEIIHRETMGFCIDVMQYPVQGYSCPCCGSHYSSAQVVSIDGGCRDSGKPEARSAIGVHFGKTVLNVSQRLDGPATNQKAELEACKAALKVLIFLDEIHEVELPRQTVIIRADSEYVVKGMTEWIFKWKRTGYLNARGQPVTNAALFREVDDLIGRLEDAGICVLFWHVPREQNADANALVNAAFDAA
ncbi:hypothetical protein G7Y79_00042g078830 [Physcia stellaris]|nr:hypothetical protein G7Y79_00042g078830 [Physcia stellaris]